MFITIKKINKHDEIVSSTVEIAYDFERPHSEILYMIEGQTDSQGNTKHQGLLNKLANSQYGDLHSENFVFYPDTYTNSRGREYRMYYVNQSAFDLLTLSLKGEKAFQAKLKYIQQFREMEILLQNQYMERAKGIAVRQALTKALQQSQEVVRMKGWAYKTYTDCIYKLLFNKNAAQLREAYNITKNENLRDYFSVEMLNAVESLERTVSGLIDLGWQYDAIKKFLIENNTFTNIKTNLNENLKLED